MLAVIGVDSSSSLILVLDGGRGLLFPGGFMEAEGRFWLADVFVSIEDPRQSAKVEHDLVELLAVTVNAVLVGTDTFVEIE